MQLASCVWKEQKMHRLQLAQFHLLSNSSNNEGRDFLKNHDINDINSSILSELYTVDQEQNKYAGYTYLHFAAKNFDLMSIKELIKQNINLVKQDFENGKTPLHIVSGNLIHEILAYPKYAAGFVGKLKKDPFVETLLSAQVKTGNTANPKSKDGTSHLHIACMYNHVEAIKLFLNAGESTDHVTTDDHKLPGYTALHFAIRYSAFEATELLLKHGADVHLKDCSGKSALHCIIERLMDIANFLTNGKRKYFPFCKLERDILESILELFLKNRNATELFDDTGLTLLHILCVLKDSSAVKNYLKQSMDVNVALKSESNYWPGWTPLHFAACFSIETFKLLLSNGANLNMKNTKGETPLDLCMQRCSPHVVHSILSTKEEYKNILFTDQSTNLLEIILLMSNDDLFKNWLQNSTDINIRIPEDSPIWPGCNLLHLAVLNERIPFSQFKMIFYSGVPSDHLYMQNEPSDCWMGIMECLLTKHFNFRTENTDGLAPFHLALKKQKEKSVDMILETFKVNESDSNGISYFHIACATGNLKVMDKLFEEGVNVNQPVKSDFECYSPDCELVRIPASSTPLHIAVIIGNERVVEYLLDNNADIHAKNEQGLDPIDLLLIINNEHYLCKIIMRFLKKMLDLKEFVTKENLSCLHIAAMYNDSTAIENILQQGVNPDICFDPTNLELRSKFADYIGKTPLHVALSSKVRLTLAVEALIKGGADIFHKNSNHLLNLVMRNGYYTAEYFIQMLKQNKRYVIQPICDIGVTMLHIACELCDVEWAKSLLERGADPNARVVSSDECYWRRYTPLDVLVMYISGRMIDFDVVLEMVELLIHHGVDVTIKNDLGKTPMHNLYYKANYFSKLAKRINEQIIIMTGALFKAQKSCKINLLDPFGLSHFHLACYTNCLDIVKKYLDSGVDVNHAYDPFAPVKRHAGYTPLHFALDKQNLDVARLLIEHGANVRAEDTRGNTPLHVALEKGFVDVGLIELVLRHGGDINAKNTKGITPIEYLLMSKAFTLEQFNAMLNNGAVIDLENVKPAGSGIIGLSMLNAEPNDRLYILKRMLNACDIKKLIEKGVNPIDSAVNIEQKGQLTSDVYLDVIEQLVEAGCDLDQQDRHGKSALHRAASLYNREAVKALLLAGANLNIVDSNDEPPISKKMIYCKECPRRNMTLNFLAIEIWKMRNVGLNVNESTKKAAFLVIDLFASIDSIINFNTVKYLCLQELNVLGRTFIGTVSLEEILSETRVVMQYARMPESQRQVIDAYFENRSNIRKLYPRWAGFLMMQYRKAVARTKMFKPAMDVIFSLGIKLPALCLDQIVQYLDYDELKLLVKKPY